MTSRLFAIQIDRRADFALVAERLGMPVASIDSTIATPYFLLHAVDLANAREECARRGFSVLTILEVGARVWPPR